MSYFVNIEKVVWRTIDGEAIILHLDSGHYYSLNKTGSLIWDLILQEKTEEEIARFLSKEYRVSEKTARKDVAEMVNHFEKELLIKAQPKQDTHE